MNDPFPSARSSQRGFTLVEVLAVVAIVVIFVALSARAFKNASAPSLTTAGNLVVDLINEARQTASAKNTKTMLVVTSLNTWKGRRLALYSYSPETPTNHGWSQIGEWHSLPGSLHLDLDKTIDNPTYGAPLFETPPSGFQARLGGTTPTVKTVTFLPDGSIFSSGDPKKTRLACVADTTNASNEYRILINPATGIPIVRRP